MRFSRYSPAVSVIVPVYQTREHLSRCLESVLNQTLKEIEIVAVDDASTDGSDEVLDRYARDDARVKVVRHSENRGLHISRITGVEASSGRFVGYVDSDDYVARDMFETMYTRAHHDRADVVRTGAWVIRDDIGCASELATPSTVLQFAERIFASGIEYLNTDFYPAMWLHLHSRHLWDSARPFMPRLRIVGEDNLTSFLLAFFAKRVTSLPHRGYVYVERDDSLSGDQSFANVVRHIKDRAKVVKALREFVSAFGNSAARCWENVRDSNKQLLLSYIESLKTPDERLKAVALYEAEWGESVSPCMERRCCGR